MSDSPQGRPDDDAGWWAPAGAARPPLAGDASGAAPGSPSPWAGPSYGASTTGTLPFSGPAVPAPPPVSYPTYPTQPLPPLDRPARRRSRTSFLVAIVATALVAGLLGGIAGYWSVDHVRGPAGGAQARGPVSLPAPAAQPSTVDRPPTSVAGLAARLQPSVVTIKVAGSGGSGTGSGFILDGDGHILTNNHVVADGANGGRIRVQFDDGSQVNATIVGLDVSYDLAVIKADVGSRPALPLGDSDKVAVGDPVIAIGAPLGLQGTVTTGIVSAKNRPVSAGDQNSRSYINAIQTDAAINPGNSGGPLVDINGNVIGINSAIAQTPGRTGTGGNIGVGFAIPSNQAKRTAAQLIDTGRSAHPIVGVSLDFTYDGEGVRVATQNDVDGSQPVTPGGPAANAGILPGDVITAIDGRPVSTPEELIVAIRAKAVGDTAVLTVRRDGGERRVTVTLAAATS